MNNYYIKPELLQFPHGETRVFVNTLKDGVEATIHCKGWKGDKYTMAILQMHDILTKNGYKKIHLFLPYMPYSRQDRHTFVGYSHSLQVFMNMLNTVQWESIKTWDLHSQTSATSRVTNITNEKFISNVLEELGTKPFLVAPDQGAFNNVQMLASMYKLPFISFVKSRDTITGGITNIEPSGWSSNLFPPEHFLIVDDICSGGGTFLALKDHLPDNALSVNLAVTHFDDHHGKNKMMQNFDRVFTADYNNMTIITNTISYLPYE